MRVFALAFILLVGCTEQERARQFGGEAHIKLTPCRKLVNVTWKENDLWLVTRPFQSGERAETYRFHESSSFGVMEGAIEIQERSCR